MTKVKSLMDTTADWAGQRQIAALVSAETGSTNDDAKTTALTETEDLVLFVTAHQTAGRGRGANTWLDTGGGEALLATWSLAVDQAPQAITGPRLGLAVFRALTSVWPSLNFSLKAPNDILLDGKKILGLLTEVVSDGRRHRLLIGLGLNVLNHPRAFRDATHLTEALVDGLDEADWFQFLDKLVEELKKGAEESKSPELNVSARRQLTAALNVQDVSASGDIVHAGGTISWHDL